MLPFLAEEVHAHRRPSAAPPFERTWAPPPAAWHDATLARRWRLCLAARDEVGRVLHAAQQAKALKGPPSALVELQVVEGSELHDALAHIGGELNDVLLVCASRVSAQPPAHFDGSPTSAAAAPDAVGSQWPSVVSEDGVVGSFDGVITLAPPADGARPAEAGGSAAMPCPQTTHVLRVVVRVSEAPKCERCWRHVPAAAAATGDEGVPLADGWIYRGCPRDGEGLCPAH